MGELPEAVAYFKASEAPVSLNTDDHPAQGGDRSASTSHNVAIVPVVPSPNPVRWIQDSNQARPAPAWEESHSGHVKRKMDYRRSCSIPTNKDGVGIMDEAKNIQVHLIKSVHWLGPNRPRSFKIWNRSKTHAVLYTLEHSVTKQVVWERQLRPEQVEEIMVPFEKGEVYFWALVGPKMPGVTESSDGRKFIASDSGEHRPGRLNLRKA
ncbi:hypothetical protein PTTG_28523 [Puccinia triticina 1-1 BBBD Race 1]|uniref:Uncharacterized protein n=2 Tax=Puccinia triticina TaxID=208348 RepID=A0A180GD56_PUCT1|nr:uncharacterized protein PtA15_2A688 [Puccinia triticina]OAV89873.1 hypothetical protein PTTG_28523 [Puccinia triticina 1-1 BBBD Race 1]WAQ82371.1 hypothetical protein PtA15_2A688 [Puccinia triticina]WAR53226.1 hypothetical protein PtB15_2B657 [Puccinia triticina]